MTNQTLVHNNDVQFRAYEMDATSVAKYSAFLKPGFVVNSLQSTSYDLTLEFILDSISKVIGGEWLKHDHKYFLQTEDCTISARIIDSGDTVFISTLEVFSKPAVWFDIAAIFSGKQTKLTNAFGVFNISIAHKVMTPRGLENINHHRTTDAFKDIRDDFYPLINVPKMMKLYSDSDETISILTGAPGTGKTCFMKKCLAEHAKNLGRDIIVTYVKDPEILKQDTFWAVLSRNAPDVLVLDDLDDELLPRSEGRNEIVNNILSFSDGLFDVPTKIIITTNVKDTKIDSAIIRPGRCFDILAIPNLTRDQAIKVWLEGFEQTEEDFDTIFGTDDSKVISQAALMSEYKRLIKAGAESYLYDPSISIRAVVQDGGVANASE